MPEITDLLNDLTRERTQRVTETLDDNVRDWKVYQQMIVYQAANGLQLLKAPLGMLAKRDTKVNSESVSRQEL